MKCFKSALMFHHLFVLTFMYLFLIIDPCYASTLIGTGQGYTLSLSDGGHVAVLEIDPTEYQDSLVVGLDSAALQGLSNHVYNHLQDNFDFLIFVNNESTRPANAPYGGRHSGVQNDIAEIGNRPIFDNTAAFGSAGMLQGAIHQVQRTVPSLHEIMHRWSVFLPEFDQAIPPSVASNPNHWGISGVGGHMGGYAPGTLVDLGNGLYNADGPGGRDDFGAVSNGFNPFPYAPLELYLMGLIDVSEFRTLHGNNGDIEIAANPEFTDESTGEFMADRIDIVNIDDIVANNGVRPPGQTSFRSMVVLLTDSSNPAIEADINAFDLDVAAFGQPGDDGVSSTFNFWEATGGRATMEVGNLFDSVINQSPVATDDPYNVSAGQTHNEAAPGVLANDTDAEGDTLTVNMTPVSGPNQGMLTLNSDGSFTYTPNAGFTGTDVFTYEVSDGNGGTDTATVTINVGAVINTPPVAVDDTYTTPEDQSITINAPGVLSNDSDADGDTVMAVPQSTTTLTLNADGSFTYTPVAGFTGTDTLSYSITDGTDTANGMITITVTPVTNPLACLDEVIALVDAYQVFADATVAQANNEILALQQAGDIAAAIARASTARTALTQEAGMVSQNIMSLCSTCVSDLQAQGLDNLVPQVQTECMNQVDRVGTIQASAVSQLESITLPTSTARSSRAALALRSRHLQAIKQNLESALTSVDRFGDRYVGIVRRQTSRGDTTGAIASEAMAQTVIQQTASARIARIQQMADDFATRFTGDASAQGLVAEIAVAAADAIARIQAAEAQSLQEIQSASA